MRVLFVCLGNICRSPAAEGVFRHIAPDTETDSAGTANWHIGDAPYAPMLIEMKARGYDISNLRARQFTPEDFTDFNLLIAMDTSNITHMELLRPPANATPLHLLTDYADTSMNHDGFVPDPYYTGDYPAALALIENAAHGLSTYLTNQRTAQ